MDTDRSNGRQQLLSRRRALALLSSGVAGIGLAACGETGPQGSSSSSRPATESGETDFAARFAGFEPADEPDGDLAMVVWPAWLDEFGPEVRGLYAFQVENGNLMRYMPCFCGCQWEDGHRNNRDCYVETVNPDGSVVFDAMAPT